MKFSLKILKIEITRKCNLDCIYCFNRSTLKQGIANRVINARRLNVIKKVISDAKDLGLKFVFITGGEAVLEPQIFGLISFCKDLGIETELYSNGISLAPELIDKLYNSGLRNIRITFITKDNSKFQYLTKSKLKNYNKVIKKNILYLKKKKIYIRVGITPILKSSLKEFTKILTFLESLRVDEVSIAPLRELGLKIEKNEQISKKDLVFIYKKIKKFRKSNMAIKFVPCWERSWGNIVEQKEFIRPFDCGLSMIFIGLDGDVKLSTTQPAMIDNIYRRGFDIKKMWQYNRFLKEERKLYLKIQRAGYKNNYCLIHHGLN